MTRQDEIANVIRRLSLFTHDQMDMAHSTEIFLDWMFEPDLLPNVAVNRHRMNRAAIEKAERTRTGMHLKSEINGGWRPYRIIHPCALFIHFAWPRKKKKNGEPSAAVLPDLTNMIGGFKHTLDGIADSTILANDRLVQETVATMSADDGGKGWMLVWLIPMKP